MRTASLCSLFVLLLCAACQQGAGPAASVPASAQASTSGSAVSQDVPAFRGSSARTGVMPGPGPIDDAAVAWTASVGAPIRTAIVTAGGRAFVSADDGTVASFDLASGRQSWRTSISISPLSSPEVVNGIVFVGTGTDGLHALDAATGVARWSVATDGRVAGAPADGDGLVVFGTDTGTVEAVDPTTGGIRWTASAGDPIISSIAIGEGAVVVGTNGGAGSGAVVSFELESGQLRWRTPVGYAGRVGTPAIAEGRVFAATGLDGQGDGIHHIVALDLATGAIEWGYANAAGLSVYTPAVRSGAAYVTGEDKSVTDLDPTTGAVVWSTAVGGVIEGNPVVAASAVYATTNGGTAVALDAATGRQLWSVPFKGNPYGPTVAGGFLLVGTDLGTLYAIGGTLP